MELWLSQPDYDIRHSLSGDTPPAIMAFTETWLDDTISDGEIAIPGYSIYRKDRNRQGGGVAIYVSEDVKTTRRTDLEDVNLELISLEVRERAGSDVSFMERFSNILFRARLEDKEITLLGDLNCNLLKSASHTTQLLEILRENNLQQLIDKPTRITMGGESLIDLMITSSADIYQRSGCSDCCFSDHHMIFGVKSEVTRKFENNISQYRAFHKCDKAAFQGDIEKAPWHVLQLFDDIDERWYHWKQLFFSILDVHIPLRTHRGRRKQVLWITEEVREMMIARNHLWKKAKKTKDEHAWVEFKIVRNFVTGEIRRRKSDYLEGIIHQAKSILGNYGLKLTSCWESK